MKRFVNLLLAVVLMLAMSPAVQADVIYLPEDNFLHDHLDSCIRLDRNFTARTDVKVYRSPEGSATPRTLPEGTTVHIFYTWTDSQGNEWGYTEYPDMGIVGWVPMAYMELVYDFISFQEDYGHLFVHTEGFVEIDAGLRGQEVYFWSYPGSEWADTLGLSHRDNLPSYSTTYTDSDGREWCYVNYYMGFRDFWICLTDPTADFAALYPGGAPEVGFTEELPPLPATEIKPGFTPGRIIVAIGVVACVGITVVVLLKKKKKNG